MIKKVSEAVIFIAIGAALFAANPRVGQSGGVYLLQLTSAEVAAKDSSAVLLNAISKAAKTLFSRVPEAD